MQVIKKNNELANFSVAIEKAKTKYRELKPLKDFNMAFLSRCPRLRDEPTEIALDLIQGKLAKNIGLYFSVGQNMNKQQLESCAELILEEYPFLKVNEVDLALKMAAKGKYGKDGFAYNSIDAAKVLYWFSAYRKLRIDEFKYLKNKRIGLEDSKKYVLQTPEQKAKAEKVRKRIKDLSIQKTKSRLDKMKMPEIDEVFDILNHVDNLENERKNNNQDSK